MILEYVKVSILRENTMKNLLLGIIAINLTFISANLALRSVEPVQAEDQRSKREIERIIERCTVSGNIYMYSEDYGNITNGYIDC